MSYATQQILSKVTDLVAAFAVATGTTVVAKELSPDNDTVEEGYYEATTLATVDVNLVADNIKSGVTIFGVVGAADIQDIDAADLTVAEAPTGKTFFAVSGGIKTGTGTKTLSAANDTVDAGYYAATTLHAVDADLAVGNIKAGTTIFGFEGTYETPITGDAAVGDVLDGKFFYADDATTKLEGTMPTVALDPASGDYPAGYHAGDAGGLVAVEAQLLAANIKDGVTIFGVEGAYDESATPITAATVQTGLEGFVNGSKVTGSGTKTLSAADDHVHAGYYEETTLAAVDTDLVTGNIKAGVTIFGVAGKTEVVDTTGAAGEVKATGTITSTGVDVTDGDTVLIDAKTYTFKDDVGTTEGNVHIGGTATATLDNLKAAINHTGTPETDYYCAAAHTTVEATTKTDTVLTLRALTAGVAGNAIDLVATAATLSASAAHLAGGLSKAGAGQISTGYFAWVDGVKVEGSL